MNWKIVCILSMCFASTVFAAERQTVVNGSFAVENDYNSNVFREHSNRTDEWNTIVSPVLILSSIGSADTLDVNFAPAFYYNHRRNELSYNRPNGYGGYGDDDLGQDLLSVNGTKRMSSSWNIGGGGDYSYYDNPIFESNATLTIEQQFLRADDATRTEVVRLLFPELDWDPNTHMAYVITQIDQRYQDASDGVRREVDRLLVPSGGDNARQRYWESGVHFDSVHEFAENSTITFAYSYEQLDNRTEQAQSDRHSHNPSFALAYQFDQQWRATFGYDFTREYFDNSSNSQVDNPNLRVDFAATPTNAIYWEYEFSKIAYDEGDNGSSDQSGTLGWEWGIDQHMNLSTSFDAAYLDRDSSSDERDFNLEATLNRNFDRGIISFSGESIYGESKNNNSWDKLRRSWEVESSVSYQLMAALSSTADISYGEWQSWFGEEKSTYDRLEIGTGVTYSFMQWFSVSVDYNFMMFETTSSGLDDFNEHTVTFTLAAAKELWRW